MSKVNIRDSVRRTEDIRFVSGQGSYIDDMNADGQLMGVFVRSPHAHAAINGFDKTDALALDGVVDVITGVDWAELGFGVIPTNSAVKENADGTPIAVPERPCLAAKRVRFVGEPVAMVIAETVDAAREARDLLEVDYMPLDAVTHPVKTLEPGARKAPHGVFQESRVWVVRWFSRSPPGKTREERLPPITGPSR